MFRRKVIRNQEVPVDPNAYQSTNPIYQYIPAGIDMMATEGESATDVLGNRRPFVFKRAPTGSFTSQEDFTKYNAIMRNRQNQMSTSGEIIDDLKQGVVDAVYGITNPISSYMQSREVEAMKKFRGEIEQNGGYIRNQDVTTYPENQYFDAPMSSEDIQKVIDETYMALIRKRESNQPLSEEELMQFENLSKRVSPNLARAYAMGGYTRNQNAVGTSLPGYGGFAGPGLPANIDADSDGIPDSYDSSDSTGGSFVFDTPTTTTESTTSPMVPFVPDTVASLPNMRQFNPYQNVGFGLSTALTSDSAGERRAGAVLTGLAGHPQRLTLVAIYCHRGPTKK